jgi:hypothetical protein
MDPTVPEVKYSQEAHELHVFLQQYVQPRHGILQTQSA